MITIQNGNFRANINLCVLDQLPLPKIRKLLKRAFDSADENFEALSQLAEWLDAEANKRKEARAAASLEVFRCKQEDRKRYMRELRKVRSAYERIMKIKALYEAQNTKL